MFYWYYQLVDKLNTNTEMEEMINDYNIVSNLCSVRRMINVLNVKVKDMIELVDCHSLIRRLTVLI